MYIKNILSGGFGSKVKIAAGQVFVTPPKLFLDALASLDFKLSVSE